MLDFSDFQVTECGSFKVTTERSLVGQSLKKMMIKVASS